ncbi:uncharacterized protein LOC128870228 [Anastrepha ludens]|uniref:uncharacterized protein LOC128870228 n=1 Tax=Anastrepha ludens TaxID=28586 RepID=UPI0023B068BB|nr:uncharacterized protein LOC128870228 [Anastrepha ludens]
MANPEGQVPGLNSMEVVLGYRVIKCDPQLSLDFLQTAVGKIQNVKEDLELKLIPAMDYQIEHGDRSQQLILYLQAHNRNIPAGASYKRRLRKRTVCPCLLHISEGSIEPLGKVANKFELGVRKAQLKIFRSANPADDANEFLSGMQLDDAGSAKNVGAHEQPPEVQLDDANTV